MACCKGPSATCECAQEARCSCNAKPAGQCTCSHAAVENAKYTDTCQCGKRPSGGCTCKNHTSSEHPGEVDFTHSH